MDVLKIYIKRGAIIISMWLEIHYFKLPKISKSWAGRRCSYEGKWNYSCYCPTNIYLFKAGNENTRKKMWNMFKFNNKNTRTMSLTLFWCLLTLNSKQMLPFSMPKIKSWDCLKFNWEQTLKSSLFFYSFQLQILELWKTIPTLDTPLN